MLYKEALSLNSNYNVFFLSIFVTHHWTSRLLVVLITIYSLHAGRAAIADGGVD